MPQDRLQKGRVGHPTSPFLSGWLEDWKAFVDTYRTRVKERDDERRRRRNAKAKARRHKKNPTGRLKAVQKGIK